MREKFHSSNAIFSIAFFLLISIFSGAFSVAVFNSENADSIVVYCPLMKKLQPVNPPKQNPLDAFCAGDDQKNRFSLEIAKEINSGFSLLNEKQFEKLVFDYFQSGKTAFGNFPKLPEFPHKHFAKNFNSAVNAGNNKENQFVWKFQNESFSFARNPRPPDLAPKADFSFQIRRNLDDISYRRQRQKNACVQR